ncbi:MAG: SPASM domain-containing protein [Bacteroidales bacterium]|nr:SPASM domain-containing protein [Bacteroidales bacterium]MCF8405108.1 SPASM domain-containing protein [Bacteroidales bacterium]
MADFINRKKTNNYDFLRPNLFKIIEIETINRCNNTCQFCPVNIENEKRPFAKMTDVLFTKIINELSQINYSGTVLFHSNNEPLLDDELENKIRYTKNKCNNVYISFYTNGKLLTVDKILKFKNAGIDKITINSYSNDLILRKKIYKVINSLKKMKPEKYPLIVVVLRKYDEVLNNRGGIAPNKNALLNDEYKYFQNSPCYLPFEEMVLRPDGKVSLCSNDAYGRLTLGDLNTESLINVWNNEKYEEIRRKLTENRRFELEICNQCDK